MKYNYDDISNLQIEEAINVWFHGERDRKIMKRRLIDCICFEPLADEFQISDRQIRKIVSKNEEIIFRHLCATKSEQFQTSHDAEDNNQNDSCLIPRFYCQTS